MRVTPTVRVNTSQGMILYRDFVIQESIEGWEWTHEDYQHEGTPQYLQVTGTRQTIFECVDAVDAWYEAQS